MRLLQWHLVTGMTGCANRTHPKMKLLNRPSIAFIDYISYRQLIDRRLIVDIPSQEGFGIYKTVKDKDDQ